MAQLQGFVADRVPGWTVYKMKQLVIVSVCLVNRLANAPELVICTLRRGRQRSGHVFNVSGELRGWTFIVRSHGLIGKNFRNSLSSVNGPQYIYG
jgi:hypothetical protein